MMTRLRTTPDETNAGRSATAPQSTRIAQSVFKLRPRAENPLRPEQQDGDEDDEDADLAEALSQPQPADRFDHADDKAAKQRAGEAAHAAQHDDGEGDQDRRGGERAEKGDDFRR